MAIPVPSPLSGASRVRRLMLTPTALVAIALCGCSINLGSLSSEPEHEAPKAAPLAGNDAPAHTTRALALVAKIVGDHGGIIECESQPRKTTFRVLLPMFNPAKKLDQSDRDNVAGT